MTTISKEILSMMYSRVAELSFDDKTTYWCTDGENNRCDIIIFCDNSTGETVQYENVVKYTTRRNVGFLELKEKAIVINLNTLKEITSYNICKACVYIYDEAVAIPMKGEVAVYSINKNEELFRDECECTNGWMYNAKGRIYDFINFGKSALLVKRDGTVGKLIKAYEDKWLQCISDKSAYCDMIIMHGDSSYMTSDCDLSKCTYVCGTNIYSMEEYLEAITVKSITEVKNLTSEPTYFEQKKYNAVLNNGRTGLMSYDLRRLKLSGVGRSILDTNFEFYKKQYLE